MKNKLKIGSGLALCACALAFAKDPIVMKVNGVDVPRSEFEYLYNKNGQQQIDKQSFDDYVEMFAIYKLKVADALAAGIDTTAAFRNELAQYRRELALPYLTDSAFLEKLARQEYDFLQQEAEVRHIMFFKQNSKDANEQSRARLDSIRTSIANGADFEEMARIYSQDKNSAVNGGSMGFITFNKIPFYSFMEAVYTTPEGKLAEGIIESPSGYHIVMGGQKRPARPQVSAHHILKLVKPGSPQADFDKAKATADSLYNVLQANPEKFEELATKYSDDPGSARQGGKLPWFGAGDMVPEFYDATWALADGEISKPVATAYGYHIIRRDATKPLPSYEEVRPAMIAKINSPRDERYRTIRDHQTAAFAKKRNAKENAKTLQILRDNADKLGVDSLFKTTFTDGDLAKNVLFTIGKDKFTAGDFVAESLMQYRVPASASAHEIIDNLYPVFFYNKLLAAEEAALMDEQPDYRNLYNEFRDGSLLYEVSLQKVWDKAAKDEAGLEKYFNQHKAEYAWKEPHVKGYLVQASNDSVADLVRARMQELAPTDSMLRVIRKEFKGNAQVDKILFAKGQNALVDYVVFGGPAVQSPNANFTSFFVFEPAILMEPQEVGDVRGLVTSDYQNLLEKEWVDQLKEKYPVQTFPKELNKLKKQ